MKILDKIKKAYLHYWKTNTISILDIPSSTRIRKRFVFSGQVQNIEFRVEALSLAQKLDLVGWIRNFDNGNVEAEIEGEENKIRYFITLMQSVKRFYIENIQEDTLLVIKNEKDFKIFR